MSKMYGRIWKAELKSNPQLFVTRIVSLCQTRQEAYDREEFFHRRLDVVTSPLYANMMVANDHVRMKDKHSEAAKKKMSLAQRGRKHPDEVKLKIAAAHKGKTLSQKTRLKISQVARNRSAEHLAKIGEASKNRSAECKKKMSAYARNRTAEHKAKLYANAKGRVHTAAARANMSAAGKGKPKSAEWKAKIRAIYAAKREAKAAAALLNLAE